MFDALTRLFAKPETAMDEHDPQLAAAALLVHLASVDGQMKPEEQQAIKTALMSHYQLDEAAVDKLVRQGAMRDAEAVDFYRFTSALTALELEDRIAIIRMMWEVVFADGKNHELEDNMVWRIAELIGVPSRERTVLRNQIGKSRSS
ncbi:MULTISPECIES: TerB family tellurite resistance protein [unclassified Devosia]|uniref:tellurite resistance TerB family protein n=2 Tax=Devosia TaxID=46913 RepID=UPI000FD9F239|nr:MULTISPECIES: TerB family tellurite resistance protein [unclassified Devosia]